MCGRYAASRDAASLMSEFSVQRRPDQTLAADYNVAPTKRVHVIADRRSRGEPDVGRELFVARWGLVPHWAKDPKIGSRMINARWETLADKPAYRRAYSKRRCLVPADGYYEWYTPTEPEAPRTKGGKVRKQPYFIHPQDGSTLAMAGLYEFWRDPAKDPEDPDSWLRSVTVITTSAPDELGRIHDRMPMAVSARHVDAWLDPDLTATDAVSDLVVPARDCRLRADPVSTSVNNVRNNGPELVEILASAE